MFNSQELLSSKTPSVSSGKHGADAHSPHAAARPGDKLFSGIDVSEAKGHYIAILEHDLRIAEEDLKRHSGQIHRMTYTLSWQVTKPLRWIHAFLQGLMSNGKHNSSAAEPGEADGAKDLEALPVPQQEPEQDVAPALSYADWIRENDTLTDEDHNAIKVRVTTLKQRPVITLLLHVPGEADAAAARATIESVRKQIYPSWSLVVLHGNDVLTKPLLDAAGPDARIVLVALEKDDAQGSLLNRFVQETKGGFVAFLDAGSLLSEHALYLFAEEIARNAEVDVVYADEDVIDARGERLDPYFKPDWNPELFLEVNYLGPACLYRKDAVLAAGGIRKEFAGCDSWDLALRITERCEPDRIRHVPAVVLHRPVAAKRSDSAAARNILSSRLTRTRAASVLEAADSPSGWRIRHPLPSPLPKVSVIIPLRDQYNWLRRCLNSIFIKTDYPDFEILLIDNQSTCRKTRRFLRQLRTIPNVRVVSFREEFNYSAICNLGVSLAAGDFVCLLNNDTEVITRTWLLELVRQAARPEVGAVGAMLYFLDSHIQHAGVFLGIGGNGVAGHAFAGFPRGTLAERQRARCVQEYSAVTAACLMLRKELYQQLGGMNETHLQIFYNDVDLCLRLREMGKRVVWTPEVELIHQEGVTRGPADTTAKQQRFLREIDYMKQKWGKLLSEDPMYNPNLSMDRWGLGLASPSRFRKPWRT
jgi:O-antigen biosynthesis protein